MCWRLRCPFGKTENFDKKAASPDGRIRILIFGVTGVTGGAVMEACINCAWFSTVGFTRAADGDFHELLIAKGIEVVSGDMTSYHGVMAAMENIDVVFLTTHYWEQLSVENEWQQGRTVIHAAMDAGVRHLIYAGTDYNIMTYDSVKCRYLDGKARIETLAVNCGIPVTIVHTGFFYENFLGLFKPHWTANKDFAIAFPMENKKLNMGSVLDFGTAIAMIALRPKSFVCTTVKLCTESLTVDEIAKAFNNHFAGFLRFYNPKLTISEYSTLDFEGSEELTTMWTHYQSCTVWDSEELKMLCPKHLNLQTFIAEREKVILEILHESTEEITGRPEPNYVEIWWRLQNRSKQKPESPNPKSIKFGSSSVMKT